MYVNEESTAPKLSTSGAILDRFSDAAAIAGGSQRDHVGLNLSQRAVKRAFDLFSVLVILALFGPLMIIIALLVSLSSGRAVIYGHPRIGRNGKEFKCYKFRSMVLNSDQVLQELLASSEEARQEWERDFKLKDDPRITRIGRFIRRTSLDELPQLWNVVRGDMSIVGPRPVVRKEIDLYYGTSRRYYFAVQPGLTGLWQVSGRNDKTYDERVALDRRYVTGRWSVVGDFFIVMRTVKVMLSRHGAY